MNKEDTATLFLGLAFAFSVFTLMLIGISIAFLDLNALIAAIFTSAFILAFYRLYKIKIKK